MLGVGDDHCVKRLILFHLVIRLLEGSPFQVQRKISVDAIGRVDLAVFILGEVSFPLGLTPLVGARPFGIPKTTGWASGSKKPGAMKMTEKLPLL